MRSATELRTCVLIVLGFLAGIGEARAISIDGYTTNENDRFSNNASFIMNSFDLSGVALTDGGRWVTMVSDNVFISANHFPPAINDSVTFYASNDPAGTTETKTIAYGQRIGLSDLWIGTLDSDLSGGFTFYGFATDDTTNDFTGPPPPNANAESFVNSPYFEADGYVFGRSPASFSTSQDMAVGRNKLDRWFDSVSAAGTTDDAIGGVVDSSGDPNFLSFEANLVVGDSGGPLFVDAGGGNLTLVGTNWFIGTSGSDDVIGMSYVGNYDAEIQNFIDTYPVPEVETGAALGALLLLGLWYRRHL